MPRPRLKLNHEALKADSDEANYWRGFLAVTANINYHPGKEPRILIELPESDHDHLTTFREFVSSEHSIISYRNSVRLTFMSQPIAVEMYERGLVKRPYAVKKPVTETSRHFWRGVIDGGACIGKYNNYSRVQFVGDPCLVKGLRDYLERETTLHANIRNAGKRQCITYSGPDALIVLKHFYGNSGTVNLRKYQTAARLTDPFYYQSVHS